MLGQEALSRMGGWKRAVASGDQRCRNEGRSYEAKSYPLLALVSPHLPCFFFVIPASLFFPVLLLEPFCLLEGSRKPSYRPPPPCHYRSQHFLKLLLLCPGLCWWGMKSRGGRDGHKKHCALAAPGKREAEIQGNTWWVCEVAAGCWWASQGSFMPCGCLRRYGLTWMDTDFLHFCCSER